MKICLAQIKPVKGDIKKNIENHKKLTGLALSKSADMIVFPELSLTGYEPQLAKELAINKEDDRLDEFQTISDSNQIIIGAGIPTKCNEGICISMILFQPGKERALYSKKYLHTDEEPFFISGDNIPVLTVNKTKIALAICYESSVPEHAENAFKNGADIYIASVAKSASGIKKSSSRLPGIAAKFSIPVLMCNSVGYCDNFESAGNSSAWNNEGMMLGQLNETEEGFLMMDTETMLVIADRI